MSDEPTEQAVEAKAKELYEASRRAVGGRPAWDKLNPLDGYDMGMRAAAMKLARKALEDGASYGD